MLWTVPAAYLNAIMIGDRSGIFVLTAMENMNLKIMIMKNMNLNGDKLGIFVFIAMKTLRLLIRRLLSCRATRLKKIESKICAYGVCPDK